MRTIKITKKEIEEEVTDKVICDNCKDIIEYADSCGFGQAFTISLSDAWCSDCGGKRWEFCSFKCLREFVNNNKFEEPHRLIEDYTNSEVKK